MNFRPDEAHLAYAPGRYDDAPEPELPAWDEPEAEEDE